MLNSIYQMLDPVAFTIGSLQVRWYGLGYLAGFICGGIIVYLVMRRWKLPFSGDNVFTFIVSCAFGIIIGARLGYVIFYGAGRYLANPLEIFMLNQGGMSFHGGLVGAAVGGYIASRVLKMPFGTLCDLGAIGAPAGLFFVRCANFANGELWGKVTTLPWGVVFANTGGGTLPRHPSQLYEAFLEGIVMLIVMLVLARKVPARPRGTFIGTFLLLYGIFRTCIEFVRVPDEQLGYLFGTNFITMGMCLSLPVAIVGLCIIIWAQKKHLPQAGALAVAGAAASEDVCVQPGNAACAKASAPVAEGDAAFTDEALADTAGAALADTAGAALADTAGAALADTAGARAASPAAPGSGADGSCACVEEDTAPDAEATGADVDGDAGKPAGRA